TLTCPKINALVAHLTLMIVLVACGAPAPLDIPTLAALPTELASPTPSALPISVPPVDLRPTLPPTFTAAPSQTPFPSRTPTAAPTATLTPQVFPTSALGEPRDQAANYPIQISVRGTLGFDLNPPSSVAYLQYPDRYSLQVAHLASNAALTQIRLELLTLLPAGTYPALPCTALGGELPANTALCLSVTHFTATEQYIGLLDGVFVQVDSVNPLQASAEVLLQRARQGQAFSGAASGDRLTLQVNGQAVTASLPR
ncbi:MAG: hypothetical protein ACOYL5_10585, partial [Phototrophicaceae bacterium]